MYGAILGDIIGSRFEFSKPMNFNSNTVNLFDDDCFYTDDTVMSIATKYAIINNISYEKAYRLFGRKYPHAGYGGMFQEWLRDTSMGPYGSFGNGSAMRVSFVGEYYKTLFDVKNESGKSAICTHNHPQGIRGAKAIATAVFLAKRGVSKSKISECIENEFQYKLNRSLKIIRPFSKNDVTCQGSVPIAIRCFLESHDFESCMRNVLSIKCDSDTVACMAGSIAEAFYKKTGFDNKAILQKYLVNTKNNDKFLFKWATKPYERS